MERLREIVVTVMVDTNKRTIERTIPCDSFEDAHAALREIAEQVSG